jgi:transcriptional regulator with XRE-family HTH domain
VVVASDPLSRTFGRVLKQLRLDRNLSQEELAHRARTTQSYLSLLENGSRSPGLTMMALLASGLGMRLSELVTLLEKPATRDKR